MYQIISTYLGIFILGIGEILFAKIVLDKEFEVDKVKVILAFFATTILCTISYIYFEGVFKTFLIYVIHIFEFKFLFNLSYLKSMFLTFLYIILLIVPDILQMLIVTNIVEMNKFLSFNDFTGSIISNLIVCILFIIITYLTKKTLRKMINTEISNNGKIICLSLITLICVGFFVYIFARELSINGDVLPYFVSMFVLIAILFSLIKQTIDNNKLTKKYDELLKYMTTFENEIEKQRILRHETKNEFLAIKAKLCDKQNNKEIVEYIDEILKEKIIINQEKYAKFGYLPPNGIKGLCYFKVQEAENQKIEVALNVSSRIKNSSIYNLSVKNQRDLGKLLGVFLDNAIEASNKSKKRQLGLEFYVNKDKTTTIIISNTFDNEINKTKIGKEKFSTKGKDRGHGLLLVKHITEKNDLFEVKNIIQNGLYSQTILIKNAK